MNSDRKLHHYWLNELSFLFAMFAFALARQLKQPKRIAIIVYKRASMGYIN